MVIILPLPIVSGYNTLKDLVILKCDIVAVNVVQDWKLAEFLTKSMFLIQHSEMGQRASIEFLLLLNLSMFILQTFLEMSK